MAESFAARCRHVLEEGPQGEADYEIAGWLIDQGLAAGRRGPPSKGRDSYGKITQLVWLGMTPAGRLWLEESARAELEKIEVPEDQVADGFCCPGKKNEANKAEGRDRGERPGQPWLIVLAGAAGVLVLMIALLFRTHLSIPL